MDYHLYTIIKAAGSWLLDTYPDHMMRCSVCVCVQQVEEELSNAKALWAREKRSLMSAHAQEIQELHLLNREQGSSNNGYIAKLEDTIEDLKAQIEDAKKVRLQATRPRAGVSAILRWAIGFFPRPVPRSHRVSQQRRFGSDS